MQKKHRYDFAMKRKEIICKQNKWEEFKKGRVNIIDKYI